MDLLSRPMSPDSELVWLLAFFGFLLGSAGTGVVWLTWGFGYALVFVVGFFSVGAGIAYLLSDGT